MVELRSSQLGRRMEPSSRRRSEARRHHEATAWRPDIQLAFSSPRSQSLRKAGI